MALRSYLYSLALASLVAASTASAQVKPFGNEKASQTGVFNFNLGIEPTTLNPITGTDLPNQIIGQYVCDSLMFRSPETYEWIPSLAEKFEKSADGTNVTFTIRKGATFHDGKPVTAEDVKFSLDVIRDPGYAALQLMPYFDGIDRAEVIDPLTVRFYTKTKYFGNFDSLADMTILPKHIYGKAEEGKKKNKTIVCSGPYKLEKYDQGQSIVIVRNKEWWGNSVPHLKGTFNFERIRFRFIKEENISIESLKKGELDYDDFTAEAYMKKTEGPEWGKSVLKVKTENSMPKPYGYVGWNLRKNMFKERDVRIALAMLMNREEMIKKFVFGMALPATGPWYQQSEYADPSVKPIKFDPKKAVEMLKKAGWTDSDKNGVLDKVVDGKKVEFRFTLIYGNKDSEKYFVFYQSDLKKVGIDMQLQLLEWNALLKKVDEADSGNPNNGFDAVALAWGAGSVDIDPKQIWHSSSIGKGGSNFIGYRSPEVDKLIDTSREELDKKRRIPLLRKVYAAIAADAPYVFMFNSKFVLYGHTAHTKSPKPTYKFEIGRKFWWAEAK
jgi:microcin C transport system substrate-binding protein